MKKIKNRQSQNLKKAQKQKKRQERIKKQILSKQVTSPQNVEDMVDYALELIEDGDWNGGEKVLEKLKKKYGHHSHVYYGLGVLAAFDDNFDQAVQSFSKAVQIKPDFVEAYYNLGVTYQKQLKIADMIETYRKVVKIGEPDSYAVHHAQDMLSRLEKQMLNDEGVDLDGFLKGEQAFQQGMKFTESKDWNEAIAKFNDSLKIAPNRPQVYGNLGLCYASIGEVQSALECFDRAIEIDPNYEPALLNRKIVEALETGERLNPKIETIEYYKDYPVKNRSYIQDIIKEQNILPEKI